MMNEDDDSEFGTVAPRDAAHKPDLSDPPVYLGDGVYMSDDGYNIWLCLGHHENCVIALDPGVFSRLIEEGSRRTQRLLGMTL
jgi:hypothetical protein